MMTPEQLKGRIRNLAKEKNIHSQEILQSFMFERFLERLSKSKYKQNIIIKGGLLISSMIGIAERTTMDLDVTIKSLTVDKQRIVDVIQEIISTDVSDGILFEYMKIKPIRKDDEYNNFSISIKAKYGKINVPLKIDITTGDSIVPKEIEFKYKMLFEDQTIEILSYTLETVLAEKIETIIRRNISNTRARDFYDVYILYQLKQTEIKWVVLHEALIKTAKKRNSEEDLEDYKEIIKELEESSYIQNIWNNYAAENTYAQNIAFTDILSVLKQIIDRVI